MTLHHWVEARIALECALRCSDSPLVSRFKVSMYLDLAVCLDALGEPGLGLEKVKTAAGLDFGNPEVWHASAELQFKLGELPSAKLAIDNAIKLLHSRQVSATASASSESLMEGCTTLMASIASGIAKSSTVDAECALDSAPKTPPTTGTSSAGDSVVTSTSTSTSNARSRNKQAKKRAAKSFKQLALSQTLLVAEEQQATQLCPQGHDDEQSLQDDGDGGGRDGLHSELPSSSSTPLPLVIDCDIAPLQPTFRSQEQLLVEEEEDEEVLVDIHDNVEFYFIQNEVGWHRYVEYVEMHGAVAALRWAQTVPEVARVLVRFQRALASLGLRVALHDAFIVQDGPAAGAGEGSPTRGANSPRDGHGFRKSWVELCQEEEE